MSLLHQRPRFEGDGRSAESVLCIHQTVFPTRLSCSSNQLLNSLPTDLAVPFAFLVMLQGLLAAVAVVAVVLRIPGNHPNIRVVPAADCAVDIDASYAMFAVHTEIVEMVEAGIQWILVVGNRTVSIREVVLVVLVLLVAEALSDDTFAGSFEGAVGIALVVVLLKRVLAGTLVVKVHSSPGNEVGVLRRTCPFDSDMDSVSSLDYWTSPPSTPLDPFVQQLQPPPPLLQPVLFSTFHVAFWLVVVVLVPLAVVVVEERERPFDACAVVASSSSDGAVVVVVRMDSSVVLDTVVVVAAHQAAGLAVAVAVRPSWCSLSFGSFVVHNRRLHPFLIYVIGACVGVDEDDDKNNKEAIKMDLV